jgi:hypothetical protein
MLIKYFLITTLIFSSYYSKSQNVTIDDLLEFKKSSIAEIEEKLTLKDWNYKGLDDGFILFTYDEDTYDGSSKCFMNFLLDDNQKVELIGIQFFDKDLYLKFINRIKSFNCKLVFKKIKENGALIKVYQGKTTTFIVIVESINDKSTTISTRYHLMIQDNENYDELYWDE